MEKEHLCLYISGNKNQLNWNEKPVKADVYFLKGICDNIFNLCGLNNVEYEISENNSFQSKLCVSVNGEIISKIEEMNKSKE